jgi:hypothetical protein
VCGGGGRRRMKRGVGREGEEKKKGIIVRHQQYKYQNETIT